MGCSMKAAYDDIHEEQEWKAGLSTGLVLVNKAMEDLEKLGEQVALTKTQFKYFEDAINALKEVTGKKRGW
jgi:hypothetical protein